MTTDFYGKTINTTVSHLDRILSRDLPQVAMAWDPTHVCFTVSATCAALFLLYLPVRICELRESSTKTASSWQGALKAVGIPHPVFSCFLMHDANNDHRLLVFYFRLFYSHT
jgi:hypothetical protein